MTTEMTYSVIGPMSGVKLPTVVATTDLTPVVAALARVELALKEPPQGPRFHVPVPLVTVQAADPAPIHVDVQTPKVHVHVPEPIINITVPEAVVHTTVTAPASGVTIMIPGIKVLVAANLIAVAFVALVALAFLVDYVRAQFW